MEIYWVAELPRSILKIDLIIRELRESCLFQLYSVSSNQRVERLRII